MDKRFFTGDDLTVFFLSSRYEFIVWVVAYKAQF